MKQSHKTLLLWIFLILMFLGVYTMFANSPNAQSVPFSEFVADMRAGRVTQVKLKDREVAYTRRATPTATPEDRTSYGPVQEWAVQRELMERHVVVHNEKDEGGGLLSTMVIMYLPVLILLGMFMYFMRQMQSSGGRAVSFGKSKARLVDDNAQRVTFADVAGIDEAKDEVEEIIAFLKDPKKFRRLGGRIPKGVLLMGPPGTGKTLLARAIAGEAGVPFFSISGSDFVEMFVGVGASRVRDLFEQGKKRAPCIIFIDEIDAVGRHRGGGVGGGHEEREQTLNQLLVEMDGFDANDGVIIIAATNRPDVLDSAIMRPGRFDRRIHVSLPDVRGREQILRVHSRRVPLAPDVELATIARGTPGFAGAELENLVNEAALLAARGDKDAVNMSDLELAKDKIILGVARKSMLLDDAEKRRTAVHEAGHALVGMLSPEHDPIHKVTIIPRGGALGVTSVLPEKDVHNYTRVTLESKVAMAMGGMMADEVVMGRSDSGVMSDLKQATRLARLMVCKLGMSDSLGVVSYELAEEDDLGLRGPSHSEQTAREIDSEVRRIVQEGRQRARLIVQENRAALDRLVEALLERETLGLEDVRAAIENRPLSPIEPVVAIETSAAAKSQEPQDERAASATEPIAT
ncbi:MAG: ATP-dependent zinc metalloprotease FtsH [Deltaproteobacteria bacterium]|nr:ATP-dependent zinc metalloprotease FtsH [Deltaproteobacteria bacterium]